MDTFFRVLKTLCYSKSIAMLTCKNCKLYFQEIYTNSSYSIGNTQIITLVKEVCDIGSIFRILNISATTIISRGTLLTLTFLFSIEL